MLRLLEVRLRTGETLTFRMNGLGHIQIDHYPRDQNIRGAIERILVGARSLEQVREAAQQGFTSVPPARMPSAYEQMVPAEDRCGCACSHCMAGSHADCTRPCPRGSSDGAAAGVTQAQDSDAKRRQQARGQDLGGHPRHR